MRRHLVGPGGDTGRSAGPAGARRVVVPVLAALVAVSVAGGCTPRTPGAARTAGPGASTSRAPSVPTAPGGPPSTRPAPSVPSARPTPSAPSAPSAPRTSAPPPKVLWRVGDSGVAVRGLQARLRAIGWLAAAPTGTYGALTAAAVRGFQGKRGLPGTGSVDTVTWARLTAMTSRPGPAELHPERVRPTDDPDRPDPRCLTGRVLCLSKTSRTLRWMVDGKVRTTLDVRFGGSVTPTREGAFRVTLKSRDHRSTLYDTPMPYAMFFSGGQAVHYSADFAANGYGGASHGCVNVRDRGGIAALFDEVRVGDGVVVHW
ncbi:peptidoglycan-binding protein [Streptomyces sp. NPDC059816]|uniref:L,D-transpeptidase family protein n=1 Tax=Streptomyces sp. NPDC059816 TaxID=3346960 RepID=UPI00364B6F11